MSGPSASTQIDSASLEEQAGRGGFDPAAFKFKKYNWLRMARLSGEEGDRWVTEFMKTPLPRAIILAEKALGYLRGGDREKGSRVLDQAYRELEGADKSEVGMSILVPKRWTLGIKAYVDYLAGDFEAALETLDEAESVVVQVLENFGFLLDLAMAGKDFTVQRARVSRNQRHWQAMQDYLDRARAMIEGNEPLITLTDGRQIFVKDVVDHYRRCRLNEEETKALEYYFDTDRSLSKFDIQTSKIGIPSDFVVPYQ